MERKEFSQETVDAAWKRANEVCEECGKQLVYENRGPEGRGCWQAHHKNGDNSDNSLDNCQILCSDCHKKTHSPSFTTFF
jgi:5-methylcytosine-specific restriction endonuclease McrA